MSEAGDKGQLAFGWEGTEERGSRREVTEPRRPSSAGTCAACRARRAFLRRPARRGGASQGGTERTLCFSCYHTELQGSRGASPSTLIVERRTRPLSAAEVAHRQRMLDHQRRQAQIGARRVVGD